MIKHRELRKKTVKAAITALIAVAVAGAVYGGFSLLYDSVAEEKATAESKYDADNGLLASLSSQLQKSGEAEKRFLEIQSKRTSNVFDADIKVLREFLATSRQRYKFDDFKIKTVTPNDSDKPELANFNYKVKVWNRFRITFKAVSDVHIFSFLDDFRSAVPGFIRIETLDLKRTADFTDQTMSVIKTSGAMPLNVEAKIEFTWIGLAPKDKPATTQPQTP
jgi:hypothetical protein